MRERARTEAAAGQHIGVRDGEVSLALVDVGRLVDGGEAVRAEPVAVDLGLRRPLGMREAGAEHAAVDHGRAVGGEDHVGQVGAGVEQFDGVAERAVAVAQVLPLGQGQRQIDGLLGVHPGVDGVRDLEVCRWAHQIAPGSGGSRGTEVTGCRRQ